MSKLWEKIDTIDKKYSLTDSDYSAGRSRRNYIKSKMQSSERIKIVRLPMSGSFKKKTAIRHGEKRPDVDILCVIDYDNTLTPVDVRNELKELVKSVNSDETRLQTHSIGLKYKTGLDIDLVLIMESEDGKNLLVGDCITNCWKQTLVLEHNDRISEISKYDPPNARKIIRAVRVSCRQLDIKINSFVIDSILLKIYNQVTEVTDSFKVFITCMQYITSGTSHYEEILKKDFSLPFRVVENKICTDILAGKNLGKLQNLFPYETIDVSDIENEEKVARKLKIFGENSGLYAEI